MKTIVKKLSLLGFIIMSSYTFTDSPVFVKVNFPNDTFTLTEVKHKDSNWYKGQYKSKNIRSLLFQGPGEKTFHWNAANKSVYYTLKGELNGKQVGDVIKGNQVGYNLLPKIFKGHHDWTLDFNSDGSLNLKAIN